MLRSPLLCLLVALAPLLVPAGAGQAFTEVAPPPRIEAIVHFDPATWPDAGLLAERGLEVRYPFAAIPAALVAAPPRALAALSVAPGILRVEAPVPVIAHLGAAAAETGARAGRTPGVVEGFGITGRGVSVAVVDFGVDATHPDLPYGSKVVANVAVAPSASPVAFVPLADTDLAGGHGTHVAGIVAGSGAASDGKVRGVAPGARLVGVSIGQAGRTTSALAAAGLDWAWRHAEEHGIRVVTASWGLQGGSAYDPGGTLERLVAALHEKGVVVVFSVGNDGLGPDGAPAWGEDRLSGVAMSPHVLAVTSYDAYALHLADSASRGDASRADLARKDGSQRRPDLAAPGEWVTSAAALAAGPLGPTRPRVPGAAPYLAMSGTSMAAPHVAGAAALVIEALETRGCPATPERVAQALLLTSREDVLVDGLGAPATAEAQGHGALDVYAAVEGVLTAPGCDLAAQTSPSPHATAQPGARGLLFAYTAGAVDPSPMSGAPTLLAPGHPVAFGARWAVGLRGVSIESGTRGNVSIEDARTPGVPLATLPIARVEPELGGLGFALYTDALPLALPPGAYLARARLDGGAEVPRPLGFTVAPATS